MMGVVMKIVFSVCFLSALLLQTARGETNDNTEASRLEAEVVKRLKELDNLESTFTTNVDETVDAARNFVKDTAARIRDANRIQTVKNALSRGLRMARQDVREMRSNMRNTICNRVEQFDTLTKKVFPPDAELKELAKKPELGDKLHAGEIYDEPVLYESLNDGQRVNRQVSFKRGREPTTLAAWKKYFYAKDAELLEAYTAELNRMKEASKKALHSLRNGIAVWAGRDDDLKDGKERPNSVDEKAAIVGAALRVADMLGCAFGPPVPQGSAPNPSKPPTSRMVSLKEKKTRTIFVTNE